jgi:hypothetical protein
MLRIPGSERLARGAEEPHLAEEAASEVGGDERYSAEDNGKQSVAECTALPAYAHKELYR